jgi:ribosomal protein S18 acetylase RimI-like enzyme
MHIRDATEADLPALPEVERAAGRMFRDIGMAEIADDEPPAPQVLDAARRAGLAWVAVDAGDRPVAYLIAGVVDGALHVEQVSVHPRAARRGAGRALIDHAARHAAGRGLTALTLTTFAEVAWNAAYYERCGFRRLDDAELSGGLVEIRRHEAVLGLDRWPRVCMRREVPGVPGGDDGGTSTRRAGGPGE